jgi:hypothetical protein
MLYASAGAPPGGRRKAEPDWTAVHRELRRPGVTLMLLWEEYRASEQVVIDEVPLTAPLRIAAIPLVRLVDVGGRVVVRGAASKKLTGIKKSLVQRTRRVNLRLDSQVVWPSGEPGVRW